MKIALLGSAFDPPHIGHFLVAEQVKERMRMDEIWFVPCKIYNPLFHKKMTGVKYRHEMVKLMANGIIQVSDIELKRKGVSYMIDTLRQLSEKRPNDTFYLVIGSDQVPVFHKWKDWKKILHDFNLIIFPRNVELMKLKNQVMKIFGYESLPDNIKVLNSPSLILSTISSTDIRERVKKGLSIKALVTKEVEEYIKSHKLYK